MNEIEIKNALQYAELQLSLSTSESKTRFFRTIVQVLRAELSRQENAPLTCDGCSHDGKYLYSLMAGEKCPCTGCKRITKDRYEPKGEKA